MSSQQSWESKFPTFVGGSPSAAVKQPQQRATTPQVQDASTDRSKALPQLKRGATPGAVAGAGAAVARVRATIRPKDEVKTPMEAIQASIASKSVALDYTASSIQPSSSTSPSKVPDASLHIQRGQHDDSDVVPQFNPKREAFATILEASQADVANGTQRMEAAVQRLHNRLAHVPLNRRWLIMASWINKYFDDHDATLLAQRMQNINAAVLAETQFRAKPCAFRTATSFMMLEQILHVLTRSKPELREVAIEVRDNLMSAIYMFKPNVDMNTTFQLLKDPSDVKTQKELIDRFYTKTYFQKLRDLQKKSAVGQMQIETLERQKERTTQLLNRVVSFWQRYVMQRVICAWRGHKDSAKEAREQARSSAKQKKEMEKLQEEIAARDTRLAQLAEKNERSIAALRSDITTLRSALSEEREKAIEATRERDAAREELETYKKENVSLSELLNSEREKFVSLQSVANIEKAPVRESFVETQALKLQLEEAELQVKTLRTELKAQTELTQQAKKDVTAVQATVKPLTMDIGASSLTDYNAWRRSVVSWISDALPNESDAVKKLRENGIDHSATVSKWDLLYALHVKVPLPSCGGVVTKMHTAAVDWLVDHDLIFCLGDKTAFDVTSDLGVLHLCAYLMEDRLPHLEQDAKKRKAQGSLRRLSATTSNEDEPDPEASGNTATPPAPPTALSAVKELARTKAKFHYCMLRNMAEAGMFK